ncbi:hypothetical protein MKW94_025179 [Papaver nudicaule]|uniref:Uncharacterized protein n=1 Tax=Papaver nudicaule TaxID=74823 RepID=A0AA41V4J1_PAPNU|nr:hypothetical protein [Papaver nudicaule]
MASFASILVYNVVFLLVSVVLVFAANDYESVVPSLEMGALRDPPPFECVPAKMVKMKTLEFDPAKGTCFVCSKYCEGGCDGMGTYILRFRCLTPPKTTNVICDCCCKQPPSPPPPPPCSPPPPPSDQCSTGDTYTETTIPTSNCADCTNWCKEDCSELGGSVIEDKCAIGESTFVRRCKCCCRGGKSAGPKKLLDLANTM